MPASRPLYAPPDLVDTGHRQQIVQRHVQANKASKSPQKPPAIGCPQGGLASPDTAHQECAWLRLPPSPSSLELGCETCRCSARYDEDNHHPSSSQEPARRNTATGVDRGWQQPQHTLLGGGGERAHAPRVGKEPRRDQPCPVAPLKQPRNRPGNRTSWRGLVTAK
jgi:hypothetical protein